MTINKFLEVYGPINNGAHRQPAELIGAPSLVWHQAFWNPANQTIDSTQRAASIESYIKIVQGRIEATARDIFTVSLPIQVEKEDRANVITFSFTWNGIRSRVRFEIHTEYLAITAILDASIKAPVELSGRMTSEFQKRFQDFSFIMSPINKETARATSGAELLRLHKFLYHDVWDKNFLPTILDPQSSQFDGIVTNKFADLRGFITCEQYSDQEKFNDGDHVPHDLGRQPIQSCFYRTDEGDRGQWQRTAVADETWARLRLNQVWPFLVSGVPAPTLDDDTYLYGRMEFTASRVLDGRMLYVSALGPQPREGRGGKHYEQPVYFFLHSLTQCERQIGRVIDRLLQLGTLRLAAIIYPAAIKMRRARQAG